ncbi:MAG: hypothetical protein K2X51_01680 [Burkholderiales bacterium]|nr:hypothetical protein [Burkholderiales bacterium]
MRSLVVVAAAIASPSVWPINKCTLPDGSVSFQDAPCTGSSKGQVLDVKPASGAVAPPLRVDAQGRPITEAQRLEGIIAASQQKRRLQDLSEREVPAAEVRVRQHLAQCSAEQAALEREKYAYKPNLFGKAHAAQVASEQATAALRCDTLDRDYRLKADALRAECQALGGCK